MSLLYALVAPTSMRFYTDWEEVESDLLIPLGVSGEERKNAGQLLQMGHEVVINTPDGSSFLTSGVFAS